MDVTNTVIKVLGGVGQKYASAAAIYGLKVDPKEIDVVFKEKWKEHNIKYPNFGVQSGITANVWWNELVKMCFIGTGHTDLQTIGNIATHLYTHFMTEKGWELLPEVNEVLSQMKLKQLQIGVVSNFDERLENVLDSVGILHNFDFVLGSQAVGHAKPDPVIFKKALEIAGVCASNALHIGDNIDNDYTAPRAIGMQSLLLCNDMLKIPKLVEREHIITSLLEAVGHAKPDPVILKKALEIAGVCASNALHIGENIVNDYNGPRAIGIHSLLLCNDMHKTPRLVERKHIITSLLKVLKFA